MTEFKDLWESVCMFVESLLDALAETLDNAGAQLDA